MEIYRVEHRIYKIGPYQLKSYRRYKYLARLSSFLNNKHYSRDTHPIPFMDGITNFDFKYFCGMKSEELLRQWFKGCLSKLREAKYIISVYESNDYIQGDYQIVFNRRKAKLIKQINI